MKEQYLSSLSVISLKIDIAFAADSDKIRLLIAEVFLRAAAGDFARSKKQWYWTPRNAVFPPPFLTEAAILYVESDAGKLLKILACSVTEWAKEGENASGQTTTMTKTLYSQLRQRTRIRQNQVS